MSHELTITNGVAEMAYAGETPWHGLGNTKPDDVEWTIDDWQREAGMQWPIQRSKVRYATGLDQEFPDFQEMPETHVLFRGDTKAPLGVVSSAYKIVQPKAVIEFFRDLTEEYGYKLNTAGTLFGGRKFWALAETGEDAEIGKGDKVKRFLLISTSADGTSATEIRDTAIRVVCNNTLSLAKAAKADLKVSHRIRFDANAAKSKLQIGAFDEAIATFRKLADIQLTSDEVIRKTVQLFKPNASELAKEEFIKAMNSKPVTRVMELAMDGKAIGSGLDGVQGSAWGWLNAVTQYVDHEGRAHGEQAQDNRLNSAWFGKGNAVKERALILAGNNDEAVSDLMAQVLAKTVSK
jgi:phage/plasmid-like protein (TIGR03299 family)